MKKLLLLLLLCCVLTFNTHAMEQQVDQNEVERIAKELVTLRAVIMHTIHPNLKIRLFLILHPMDVAQKACALIRNNKNKGRIVSSTNTKGIWRNYLPDNRVHVGKIEPHIVIFTQRSLERPSKDDLYVRIFLTPKEREQLPENIKNGQHFFPAQHMHCNYQDPFYIDCIYAQALRHLGVRAL